MPIHNNIITLSNTVATLVVPADNMEQQVALHNNERFQSRHIHFGNSDMTLENSLRIDRGETLLINLGAGDELWAMSDGNNYELGVLRITQD